MTRTMKKVTIAWLSRLACLSLLGMTGCHQSQQAGPDVDSIAYEITDSAEDTWRDMEREVFGDDPSKDTPEKAELRKLFKNKHNI